MEPSKKLRLVFASCCLTVAAQAAKPTFSPAFAADGAVHLERIGSDIRTSVWGKGTPGLTVEVEMDYGALFVAQTAQAVVGNEGEWQVDFTADAARERATLTARYKGETDSEVLKNVALASVWIVHGWSTLLDKRLTVPSATSGPVVRSSLWQADNGKADAWTATDATPANGQPWAALVGQALLAAAPQILELEPATTTTSAKRTNCLALVAVARDDLPLFTGYADDFSRTVVGRAGKFISGVVPGYRANGRHHIAGVIWLLGPEQKVQRAYDHTTDGEEMRVFAEAGGARLLELNREWQVISPTHYGLVFVSPWSGRETAKTADEIDKWWKNRTRTLDLESVVWTLQRSRSAAAAPTKPAFGVVLGPSALLAPMDEVNPTQDQLKNLARRVGQMVGEHLSLP